MNDFHHPCKHWAEAISMAAAGCLSSDEEREIRRHMETCSACREHFRQLTEVCSALTELRLPTNGEDVVIVQRVMSAIALSKPRPTCPLVVGLGRSGCGGGQPNSCLHAPLDGLRTAEPARCGTKHYAIAQRRAESRHAVPCP